MCVLHLGESGWRSSSSAGAVSTAGLFAAPADVMMLLDDEWRPTSPTRPASRRSSPAAETFLELYDIDPPFVLTTDPPPLRNARKGAAASPDGSAPTP